MGRIPGDIIGAVDQKDEPALADSERAKLAELGESTPAVERPQVHDS